MHGLFVFVHINSALNRNVLNFLVQFGIGANYEQRSHYRSETIVDDPQWEPPIPFQAGYLSYAGSGKNSRSVRKLKQGNL